MKKEKIEISLSELRFVTESVFNIVSDIGGINPTKLSLKTSINNELGIQGDDWEDLVIKVKQEFNCEFSELNFYDYFLDETQISYNFFLNLLYLPFRLIIYLSYFDINILKKIWNHNYKNLPDLPIKDLITSILYQKWTPNEMANITIKK